MNISWKLGLLTLLIFGIGGVLIIEFVQDRSVIEVMSSGQSPLLQISAGITAGLVSSAIAIGIISRPFFHPELRYYSNLITGWKLTLADMIFLSICAGFAEELFFRAGIQPLLGIWWTALIFVFIHGYLNPNKWRISIYGAVLVGIIAGFGYLYEWIGILTPMVAHAILDLALFHYLSRHGGENP